MLVLRARSQLAERITFSSRQLSSSHLKTDHYSVLGLKNDATQKEIKTAFYQLSKKYHPDVAQGEEKQVAVEKFQQVLQAYEILGSAENRKIYDMTRIRSAPSTSREGYAMSFRQSRREKQYTDIDIDYKDFEHFQKSNRNRRQTHSSFDFPKEFYEEMGANQREFRSEWDEESAKLKSIYRDSRSAAREEQELRAELERRKAAFEARYKTDPFDKMIERKKKEAQRETMNSYLAMLSISTLGLILFFIAR